MTAYNFIDLTGQRFDRLSVLERVENRFRQAHWRCICDCGKELIVNGIKLRSGHTRSCGCLRSEIAREQTKQRIGKQSPVYKHGLTKHRFYETWKGMIHCCYDEKNIGYHRYGGRGIIVCDEWRNGPELFLEWCDEQGNIPKGFVLDRENNNGNYCPENCRFVTHVVSDRNRRDNIWIEYNNERMIFTDFVSKYGVVSDGTARKRVSNGSDYIEAALTPLKKIRKTK